MEILRSRRNSGTAVIGLVLLGAITGVFSTYIPISTERRAVLKELKDSLSWCPSKISATRISVSGSIENDGFLQDIRVEKADADPQLNAECVEALASVSPLYKTAGCEELPIRFTQEFANTKPFRIASEVERFFSKNPELKDKCIVIHKIPPCVLKKRPGLFKDEEIFSVSNCTAVNLEPDSSSGDDYTKHIVDYYAQWGKFFVENREASRKQILEKERSLEAQ